MEVGFKSKTAEEIDKAIPVLGLSEEDEKQFYNKKELNLSKYDSQLRRMEEILQEMDKKAIEQQPLLTQVYLRLKAYMSGKTVKELVDAQHQQYLEDIARKLDADIAYYKELVAEMDKEIEEKKDYRNKAGLFYRKFKLIEREVRRKIEELQEELYRRYEEQAAGATMQNQEEGSGVLVDDINARLVDAKEIASLEVELDKMQNIDLQTAVEKKEYAAVEFRNADVYVQTLSAKRNIAAAYLEKLKNKRTAIEITKINKEIVSKKGLNPIGFVKALKRTDELMSEIDRDSVLAKTYNEELLKLSAPTDEDYKPTVSFEDKAEEMAAQQKLHKSTIDDYVERRLEELHRVRR